MFCFTGDFDPATADGTKNVPCMSSTTGLVATSTEEGERMRPPSLELFISSIANQGSRYSARVEETFCLVQRQPPSTGRTEDRRLVLSSKACGVADSDQTNSGNARNYARVRHN